MGIEPMTTFLPRRCSTTEPRRHDLFAGIVYNITMTTTTKQHVTTRRRKKDEPRQLPTHLKLSLLLLAGIFIVLADAYFSTRDTGPHQPPKIEAKITQAPLDKEAVLGEFEQRKSQVESIIEDNLSFLKIAGPTIGQEVASQAQKLVDDNAPAIQSQVGENVETIINENAIKPLVKQIENLSESQQQAIREVICAEPTPTKIR